MQLTCKYAAHVDPRFFALLCVALGAATAVLGLPRTTGALAILGGALALALAVDVPYLPVSRFTRCPRRAIESLKI